MICPIQTDLKKPPFNCIHFTNVGVFKCLRISVPLPVRSWRQLTQLDLVVDNNSILNEHSVNGEIHYWHGIAWHEQASPYVLQLYRSVRHAVVHCQWMIFSRFCGTVITGNILFFVSATRQPQSMASIASSFLIHVMT